MLTTRPSSTARRGALRTIALAALLVVYGNGKALILGDDPAGSPLGVGFGLLLVGLMVVWAARVSHLAPADLGITRSTLLGSARLALGLVLAIGALAALLLALLGPERLAAFFPDSLRRLPVGLAVRRVLLFLPFDTVIPEELAFRGVLQAELRRRLPPYPALAVMALVFGLWHVAITWRETNPITPLPILGKLAGDAAFGLLFGVVRQQTGNLVGGGILHWASDAAGMLVGVLLVPRR